MQLESSIFLYQKGMIMSWTIFEYFSKQNMFGIFNDTSKTAEDKCII